MSINNRELLFLAFFAVMAAALIGAGRMASAQITPLSCAPFTQDVILGNSATLTATGGDGTYLWSAPGLNVINPTGAGFSANYASIGTKTITVTSAGQTAQCFVNVLAGATPTPPTPGLPSTGEPAN